MVTTLSRTPERHFNPLTFSLVLAHETLCELAAITSACLLRLIPYSYKPRPEELRLITSGQKYPLIDLVTSVLVDVDKAVLYLACFSH